MVEDSDTERVQYFRLGELYQEVLQKYNGFESEGKDDSEKEYCARQIIKIGRDLISKLDGQSVFDRELVNLHQFIRYAQKYIEDTRKSHEDSFLAD